MSLYMRNAEKRHQNASKHGKSPFCGSSRIGCEGQLRALVADRKSSR